MPGFYILDDSSYYRDRSKNVELASRCWDHTLNRNYNGFRMPTLTWSDGLTTIPVCFCNMSSENKENRIKDATDDVTKIPENSFGKKIREYSCAKMNDTMIKLINDAQENGPEAKYVLCDRWFSAPESIFAFTDQKLDVITMLKQDHTKYIFEDKENIIKEMVTVQSPLHEYTSQ